MNRSIQVRASPPPAFCQVEVIVTHGGGDGTIWMSEGKKLFARLKCDFWVTEKVEYCTWKLKVVNNSLMQRLPHAQHPIRHCPGQISSNLRQLLRLSVQQRQQIAPLVSDVDTQWVGDGFQVLQVANHLETAPIGELVNCQDRLWGYIFSNFQLLVFAHLYKHFTCAIASRTQPCRGTVIPLEQLVIASFFVLIRKWLKT